MLEQICSQDLDLGNTFLTEPAEMLRLAQQVYTITYICTSKVEILQPHYPHMYMCNLNHINMYIKYTDIYNHVPMIYHIIYIYV